ncbi:MAG TPA: hypothetical protein VGD60_16775 [Candidatus Acidoferrales bacterium]
MRSPQPSLEYLATCSESSLEGFELARLGEIAQLRREIQKIHEEWIEAEVAARLTRLLLEGRRTDSRAAAELLASPDPSRAPAKILPAALSSASPSPYSKNGSSALLSREYCKERPSGSLAPREPTEHFASEVAASSGEGQALRSAVSALPDSSRRRRATSRSATPGNRQLPEYRSAKIQAATPLRIRTSSQLALFDEARTAAQLPESTSRPPVRRLPKRAIVCLTPKPRVRACSRVSLCVLPAAS